MYGGGNMNGQIRRRQFWGEERERDCETVGGAHVLCRAGWHRRPVCVRAVEIRGSGHRLFRQSLP